MSEQQDRVDITSMTDAEKAAMYEKQRQDMVDRQPQGKDEPAK